MGRAGLVGKTGLGIGRLAMGHPVNTQVELSHGSVCLGIQESVCDCAWKLLAKGKHGFQDKRKKTKDIQHVICK